MRSIIVAAVMGAGLSLLMFALLGAALVPSPVHAQGAAVDVGDAAVQEREVGNDEPVAGEGETTQPSSTCAET